MDDVISRLDYTLPEFSTEYGKVINWIHYEVDRATLVRELGAYTHGMGAPDIAAIGPTTDVSMSGAIAYCLNRGAKLSPTSKERLENWLHTLHSTEKSETSVNWEYLTPTATGKNIQAYVNSYSQIDNLKTRFLAGKVDIRELPIQVRKIIADRAQNKTNVTRQLLEHYRESLVECQDCPVTKSWQRPLKVIVDTISIMVSNRAGIRAGSKKSRAHKMSTTVQTADRKGERAAAKVNYKDTDTDLGIDSVLPTNLIGSDAAVIYNTKNRHCEVYFAETGKKLSITGAKITNFDVEKSQGRTLRKPEQDLPHWSRASNARRLEVLLEQFNGKKWSLAGKLNRNTMILAVIFS